jgi:hypothetical protein
MKGFNAPKSNKGSSLPLAFVSNDRNPIPNLNKIILDCSTAFDNGEKCLPSLNISPGEPVYNPAILRIPV